MKQNETSASAIDHLFNAKSIAIIGASPDQTKLSSSPLNALKLLGYSGTVSTVNPRYDTLLGRACYRSIAELPDGVPTRAYARWLLRHKASGRPAITSAMQGLSPWRVAMVSPYAGRTQTVLRMWRAALRCHSLPFFSIPIP
jgi:hypothetical protein